MDERIVRDRPAHGTRYMAMCVQANQARKRYSIYAGCFSWLTLAGYVVLPNTFTSLRNSGGLDGTTSGRVLQTAVHNVQLLPLAGVLCCIGTAGSCWLWWRWRKNYVWLIAQIFLPGLSSPLLGLFTTVVNVFAMQGGNLSLTAKVTVVVTTVCGGSMLAMNILYNYLLDGLMTEEDRAVAQHGWPTEATGLQMSPALP